MKKTPLYAGCKSLCTYLLASALAAGCLVSSSKSALADGASATKNSFKEVTAQLDPGGNLYVYLSTEQWLTGLSDKISSWRAFIKEFPDIKPEDRKNVERIFDVVTSLVRNSGIEQVSGAGFSSVEREPGFYHSKFVLHHYKGQGSGYLWSMFGKSAHPLTSLDMLPANTAVASFSDFDLPMLWSVLVKEVHNADIPGADEKTKKIPAAFEGATGLKLDDVLASLGNEYGLVITLNDANKIVLPIPGMTTQIPEPGLMLVIKVKNDLIFNRVDELLKGNDSVIKSDKYGVKMRTMPVPLPLPITLRPTIARSGDYLIIASTDLLVQEALAVKAGQKPGLKSTDEFKTLAKGMPESGNQFSYVSSRFAETWKDVQGQMLQSKAGSSPAWADLMKKLMALNSTSPHSFSVSANGEEGWVGNANGNQDPSKIVLLPAVVAPAMLAGFTLPALAKAKAKAQSVGCVNNLKQLQLAKKMWADDKNKKDDDIPTFENLKDYLPPAGLKCPTGGTYQLNKAGVNPTCSQPGHQLNN